jgi:hypothetical protein
MIRENLLYKILSNIHIVFFTSILCFGTIYLTGTLLLIPAFAAVFCISKDFLYKKLDINDSIIKTYFKYLKAAMKLIKFIPINLIMILNIAGMIISANLNSMLYSIICLSITAILFLLVLYIAGYYSFVDEKVDIMEVVFSMVMKPQFVLPIFIVLVLCIFFFSFTIMIILLVAGTFFLFAISVVIFINMLYYKKALGKLDEKDEYAHLINVTGKK